MPAVMIHLTKIWQMIVVFFSSILPFCESKGSMIIAGMFHLRPVPSGIVSSAGAFVPVPFILKGGRLPKKAEESAGKRQFFKDIIRKYGCWALLAVVAIPCTGIGTWLGAIIARLVGVDSKRAAAAIFIGNCIATFVMAALVAGVSLAF